MDGSSASDHTPTEWTGPFDSWGAPRSGEVRPRQPHASLGRLPSNRKSAGSNPSRHGLATDPSGEEAEAIKSPGRAVGHRSRPLAPLLPLRIRGCLFIVGGHRAVRLGVLFSSMSPCKQRQRRRGQHCVVPKALRGGQSAMTSHDHARRVDMNEQPRNRLWLTIARVHAQPFRLPPTTSPVAAHRRQGQENFLRRKERTQFLSGLVSGRKWNSVRPLAHARTGERLRESRTEGCPRNRNRKTRAAAGAGVSPRWVGRVRRCPWPPRACVLVRSPAQ
jgi:hypothetical protein